MAEQRKRPAQAKSSAKASTPPKTSRKPKAESAPPLWITAPRSMQRAYHVISLLIALFAIALVYLAYTLITESRYYVAKAGKTTYGYVYDRKGDVLFDGTQPLDSYPAGQFADIGSLIGDTSGQMTNTLVSTHLDDLANYSFLYGNNGNPAEIRTTLSHAANRKVFDALGQKRGSVIAYNWKTGELLVCVSKPCVDIAEGYANLAQMPSGSLLCKPFYPIVPGSTQKVSTVLAAYEAIGVGTVNATEYACSGSWLNAKGQKINCHEKSGHGRQTLAEAFENSCNPYFAQLVQSDALPLSRIVETFTRMGYSVNGEAAAAYDLDGIRIAPASLTLKDADDFDTQWSCLGQGDTLISPYQLMLWQGAIANGSGKAVLPYLVSETVDSQGNVTEANGVQYTQQMFTAEAAQAVQKVMYDNAEAHYYVSLSDFTCGVKSGTAQVTDNGKAYENSLLVGFCLDAQTPIAFCIVIEERVSGELSTAQLAKVLLNTLAEM